jgi:hypothetical protein
MVLTLAKLELHDIERLSRLQLIDAVLLSRDHIPDDLIARAEQLSIDHLRLLLLAARLICVLRHLQTPAEARSCRHGDGSTKPDSRDV